MEAIKVEELIFKVVVVYEIDMVAQVYGVDNEVNISIEISLL